MRDLLPELATILDDMTRDDPIDRLTMSDATDRVKRYIEGLEVDTLQIKAWQYCNVLQPPFSSSDAKLLEED